MLYTFSKSVYLESELRSYLEHTKPNDALLLWQDGVLLPFKYPHLFSGPMSVLYVLKTDVIARHLEQLYSSYDKVRLIELEQFITLSEMHYPQLAL